MGKRSRWLSTDISKDDLVTRQRASVLLIANATAVGIAVAVLLVTILFRTGPPTGNLLDTTFAILIGAATSMLLLKTGRYRAAAHLTVSVTMVAIWVANLRTATQVDVKSEVSYILAGLLLSAVLLGNVWASIYGLASIVVTSYMALVLARTGEVSLNSTIGFTVDHSASIVFVVILTSVIATIYERALERVRKLLSIQQRSNAALTELTNLLEQGESQRRQFYRDTIYSVTGGKLRICDQLDIAHYVHFPQIKLEVSDAAAVPIARHEIMDYVRDQGLSGNGFYNFEVAVGEAITNGVKHGGPSRAFAGRRNGSVWVGISDAGPGIESLIVPKAILLKGFSTKRSLGLGYSVILDACDQVLLKTGDAGTTVILIKALDATEPEVSLDDFPDAWGNG